MPRPRRSSPEPPPAADPPTPANSLIASAATLSRRVPTAKPRNTSQDWQEQGWYYFDTCGELRFGCNWIANAMSRVTLALRRDLDDGSEEEVAEGPAFEALEALFAGEAGQSQMLGTCGLHLTVPGETYLIGEPAPEDEGEETGPDRWLVASNDEVSERAGRWYLDQGAGKRPLAEDSMVIRIWRPHPRRAVLADSSVRAVLPVLREIEQLTKHVAATVDSRLAGAGILFVPSEMTFSTPPTDGLTNEVEPDPDDPLADTFTARLTEAMLTPIEDRGSATAVVPVVVKAPGALLDNVKHLTFSTPLDEHALELRAEGIRRLALGLDVPPEVVLGQGDSNHWSAWQIEESALKVHVEPMVELICAAITQEYLRPVLDALGVEDAGSFRVVGDTSDLRLRPDHSQQALELYDRLELGGDALRRETGFEDEDGPDATEFRVMLLRKMALGAVTPEAAIAAADALGVALDVPPPEEGAETPDNVVPIAPAPPPPEVRREIPAQQALLAAGEVLVLRALERANNRLNRRGKVRRPFTSEACDLVLADAWDHAPRVAALCGVDAEWLVGELDRYTRALLSQGAEHAPTLLARVLTEDGTRARD